MTLPAELVKRLVFVEVSPGESVTGWSFDFDAIADVVVDQLKLKYPVKIRFSHGRGFIGTHRAPQEYNPRHRIAISNRIIRVEHANRTLWHELAHAVQSEHWAANQNKPIGSFYREGYRSVMAQGPWGASYEQNIYELHAGRFAEQNQSRLLIRGGKTSD